MEYQIGDIVEIKTKYRFGCCDELYRINRITGKGLGISVYEVSVLCNTKHGRNVIGDDEIIDDPFTSWVKHVRKEHGLTT